MDSLRTSADDSKSPACQCAPKSAVHRWSPGIPVAMCMLMSLSSITVCLLMSFKTLQLEQRLKMELDRVPTFHAGHGSFLNKDGDLVPELSASVGKLVEEKVMVLMPKIRTTRDVGQECACPPEASPNRSVQSAHCGTSCASWWVISDRTGTEWAESTGNNQAQGDHGGVKGHEARHDEVQQPRWSKAGTGGRADVAVSSHLTLMKPSARSLKS